MNAFTRLKRSVAWIMVLVMILAMVPVSVHAASAGRESDTIFFATDRHEESSKLKSLLQALAYTPGLVVLGGDHVNNTNSGSLSSITAEIQAVYPGVQTFYTYAAHDPNVSEDSSNPYAYARTGEYYEGEDYYVYGVDQDDMQSASSAATASANFKTWAAGVDSSKVIFVMCHMPIHSRRGDNAGGATWMSALNEVGESHDVVFLWGHNHTGESSADTSVYFVGVGGSLTPQGGSTGTIQFTYMNAGYIKNGYCSMVVVNDDAVDVTRYSTSGSATANYTIERRFAETHVWEITESVAATCDADGYEVMVCTDCGESKTTVIPATGHAYTEEVKDTCTGSFTVYTCTVCGYSYSQENPTETTYDAVSSLTEGESYVIVASNYALTYGSSAGKTAVTVSNGSITSDVTDAMIWTYENGMLSNSSSGSKLYINLSGNSSRRTITFSTTGVAASYSSSKLKLGSYYLYHSSNSGFSARSSGSTVTLYQVNEAMGGTGEHVYESVTVEPTCTQDGSVTYTCTACGDSYTEVLSANGSHAYECVTTEATCTAEGSRVYTCTVCGEGYTEIIPALGHDYTAVVTAPTCTESGFTTYTCACGDAYVADETAALGHSYDAVTTEATCTENGSVVYTCACGESYTEIIPALGHDYTAVVTAPTCVDAGYTTYTCACGDTYVADETAALGHSYEAVTVEPTCTTGGYTALTCVHCGDATVTDETAALGHAYTSVTTEATCTASGCTTHTCARCGDSYVTDEVAALGHELTTATVEATCTADGSVTTTCERCCETSVEVISALGHTMQTVTVPATCTADGSVTETCERCGISTTEVIPALGHSYTAVTTEATCTENGSIVYTCVCGDSYSEVIEALGHDYTAAVTAPTCESAGYTTHTCATCGDSYVTDETAALGHSYTAVTTEATCTTDGSIVYTCACGERYSEVIPALGHSYTAVEENGCMVYTCGTCGHSYSEKLTSSYNQVSAFTAGENYVLTVCSDSTYYALSHSGNGISTVEVTVENGEITSEITDDLLWTYEDGKLSYVDNGSTYYLYIYTTGWWFWTTPNLGVSTSESAAVSFSGSALKVGSYYLRYSGGKITANSRSTTAYLFEEN